MIKLLYQLYGDLIQIGSKAIAVFNPENEIQNLIKVETDNNN